MDRTRLEQLLHDLQSDRWSPRRAGVQLCVACVDLLAVDGAGIMLVDGKGDVSSFGASDVVVGRLEDAQFTLGEGPGVEAHATRLLVWEPDLEHAARAPWTVYGPAAADEGVAAVFAVPLRVGGIGLGALDLYLHRPGPLGAEQLTDAMALAGVVIDVLLSLQAGAAFGGAPIGIDVPGGLRAHVHQASGMISEQLDIPIGDALVRLRGHAYAAQRPINDVARDVIERRLRMDDPPECDSRQ